MRAAIAIAIALLVFASLAARRVSAQDDAAVRAEAEKLHRAAVVAFAHHQYRTSIERSTEADRLLPSAANSYNIARAYEGLKDSPQALIWYRDYLNRDPNAPDRNQVALKIARYESALDQHAVQARAPASLPPEEPASAAAAAMAAATSPPTGRANLEVAPSASAATDTAEVPPPSEPQRESAAPAATTARRAPPSHSALRTVGVVSIVAGGLMLGGALLFELARRSVENRARHETEQIPYAHDLDVVQQRRTAAQVLAALGGSAAIGGIVLFAVAAAAPSPEESSVAHASIAVGCATAGCGLSLRGRY